MLIALLVVTAPFVLRSGGMVRFVLVAAAASGVWLALVVRQSVPRRSLRYVLLIAIVLRIPLWLSPPELSGDVWRYLWDGTVSLSGVSPYSAPPDAPSLIHLRSDWHQEINHPEIPTIYPPYAQLLFLIPALGGGSLLLWRLTLLLFELVALRLLHRLSPSKALLWAVCPLAVWEGHWSAHVDLAAAAALLAAVVFAARPLLSGGALAVAAGIKIVPLVALPMLLSRATRRVGFTVAFLVTSVLATLPFLGGPIMPGASDYARRWSFNGPVHLPIVTLVERLGLDDAARHVWTLIKDPLRLEPVSATVYGLLYPDFLTRVVLAAMLAAGVVWIARESSDLPSGVADSLGLLLILSPTIHPWYWLPVAVVALVAGRHLWLFLAAGSVFSYLLYQSASPILAVALSHGVPLLAWLLVTWRATKRADA